ncbi:MAG: phosphoribosyl-AMP cyclohydrolase [Methanomicrobiales archaeon]|nr:phosphoribosyl-AMP cyclohydrolase [Methanomicrobiales archaeon]
MIPLHFDNGLIPVIAQDAETNEVLMLAYANEEAVKLTIATGQAHYFSRSRKRLWKKGEESGHTQRVVRILTDCDEDALIYQIEQEGAACHLGYRSCFFRTIDGAFIAEKVFNPGEVYANKQE